MTPMSVSSEDTISSRVGSVRDENPESSQGGALRRVAKVYQDLNLMRGEPKIHYVSSLGVTIKDYTDESIVAIGRRLLMPGELAVADTEDFPCHAICLNYEEVILEGRVMNPLQPNSNISIAEDRTRGALPGRILITESAERQHPLTWSVDLRKRSIVNGAVVYFADRTFKDEDQVERERPAPAAPLATEEISSVSSEDAEFIYAEAAQLWAAWQE